MKKTTILFALFPLIFGSCKEDIFDYRMMQVSIDDVAQVDFYTGTSMMIADGQAQLNFIVELFREVAVTDEEGNRVQEKVPIFMESLPEGSVKIFNSAGQEVPNPYTTTSVGTGSETFYAKVGNITSVSKTVTLRSKPALPPKRYIDLIYHVFELSPTDATYNPLSYAELDYNNIVEATEHLNAIFNNEFGTGPNSASANITFRLATHSPTGQVLEKPGYNKIVYTSTQISNQNTASQYAEYMNSAAGRIWEHTQYLNVAVYQMGANMALTTGRPLCQVVPEGSEPLPGLALYENLTEAQIATLYQFNNTCVSMPTTVLRPGPNRPYIISSYFGTYFGLYITRGSASATPPTDYCTDTQIYVTSDAWFNTILQTTFDGEKFLANNGMDDRYPSLRNNFTLDQVNRMRYCMENCPGRQNSKTQ